MEDRCIHGLELVGESLRGNVLTIGNFDGVHLGHQRILQTARSLADKEGLLVVGMTFEPPPERILEPGEIPKRISPPDQRSRLLLESGCDFVVIAQIDRSFLSITADEFIEKVLLGRFAPRCVVEGRNFFFGAGRSGNVEMLQSVGRSSKFEMHVVDPVMVDLTDGTRRISSSLIRSLIEAGRVADAARSLGRQFALFGKVVKGTGRGGKLLGFPTMNIATSGQIVPADGIYAGKVAVGGRERAAAITIGVNPTLGGEGRTIEAFLIDTEGDFYDREVTFLFVEHLREQEKFESIEQLKEQIAKDVQRVRKIIG